jgi:hypothetical protein
MTAANSKSKRLIDFLSAGERKTKRRERRENGGKSRGRGEH